MPPPPSRFWTRATLVRTVGGTLVVGLVVLALSSGCSSVSSDRPPIADSTLTTVLKELHLSVARHNTSAPYPKGLRDSVLAHYGISQARFDATLEYYSRHPSELKSLYGPIIDSLKALQYQRQKAGPSKLPDSLSRPGRQRPSNR